MKRTVQWYVEATIEVETAVCRCVRLHFMQLIESDAARDLRDMEAADPASGYGATIESYKHYVEVLQRETGDTRYLSSGFKGTFTMTIQRDHVNPERWYAPHITHAALHPDVARAIARLCKLIEGSERNAIDAIKLLRAKPVREVERIGYIPCKALDALK